MRAGPGGNGCYGNEVPIGNGPVGGEITPQWRVTQVRWKRRRRRRRKRRRRIEEEEEKVV